MAQKDETMEPMAGGRKRPEGVGAVTEKPASDAADHDGGTTTRDDATDMGVPMLPGDPSEPQGPEDALGAGPKRGDYTGRLGETNYQPHQVGPVSDPVAGGPTAVAIPQAPRAEDQGDVAGQKGGVDTHAEAMAAEVKAATKNSK